MGAFRMYCRVDAHHMCATLHCANRREREMMRALNQHNKAATRLRNRESHAGPPDDLDIEWEHLVSLRNATGYGSDTDGNAAATTTDNSHAEPMDVERPPFPPPFVALQPAFPPEIDQSTGTALLSVWSFLHSFPELLGLVPCSFEALAGAMVQGRGSALLGRIHVALLRLLQADMEEAHAHGLVLVRVVRMVINRGVQTCTLSYLLNHAIPLLYIPAYTPPRVLQWQRLLSVPHVPSPWKRHGCGGFLWMHGARTSPPSHGQRCCVNFYWRRGWGA